MTVEDTVDQVHHIKFASDQSPKTKPVSNGIYHNGHKAHAVGDHDIHIGLNGYAEDIHNGPDQIVHAEARTTTRADAAVKMRLVDGVGEIASLKPESVVTWFNKTADAHPNREAMKVKRNDQWKTWTYKDYQSDVRRAAKSFIKLGLKPFHAVGIIGFNAPEWFISDIGAIYAGGLAVGIYTTNTAEACQFNATDSSANIIVVEDDKQLQKIMSIWKNLPELKAVIQYIGQPDKKHDNVYGWDEFLALSADVPDSVLNERHKLIAPNKCCTIIYTSGTTGNPKGAMLSHDNLIWTSKSAVTLVDFDLKDEVFISYLPLSHVAAQMTDLYIPITTGGLVYFAQPDALKGTLVDTLKEARPTGMIGVPRVWEKIMEKMKVVSKQNGAIKQWIARWAKDVGLRGNLNRMKGHSVPWGWTLANALVFKKVRQALGLDRCRITASGAAPLMRETQEFFLSLNIPILDIYGMSESSAPHTANVSGAFKLGSAGRELPGVSTKIANPDADGNGEICMFGRHVFMGYLGQVEKTRDAVDADGYLHTGDIGRFDEEKFLFITGRLKELIITAGGENIPPVAVEDVIKEELQIVSHAMLIGDKRKFLSVLLTLKSEIDLNSGEPLNQLTRGSQEWIKEKTGLSMTAVDEARVSEPVKKAIQAGIDRANKRATSRAQVVQKFEILPEDFSIPGGELGPTMKMKRPVAAKKYSDVIENFYLDAAE